jgi:hypothetical protein
MSSWLLHIQQFAIFSSDTVCRWPDYQPVEISYMAMLETNN